MSVSPSKENILKKIRKALSHSTPLPFPQSEGNQSVFQPLQQEPEVEFAEQFTKLQGKFIYCINQQELAFLCAHECDEIQGHFFSQALPSAEFEVLLKSDKCWKLS